MLTLAPLCVGLALLIFVLTVALTRMAALGSILSAMALPVFVVLLRDPSETALRVVSGLLAVFIVFRHRSNIKRMMEGTELKIGSGEATATATSDPEVVQRGERSGT
jgi:glycerol-3-phosphate acyltransferase PlsY